MTQIPSWVKQVLSKANSIEAGDEEVIAEVRAKLTEHKAEAPDISILMPAWNEEENIVKTLCSLAFQKSEYSIELWVVNNNSTDGTQHYLDLLGVNSVMEKTQGISYARQTALDNARGQIIISCDSDSLYPPEYVNRMAGFLLKNNEYCAAFAQYRFLPGPQNSRKKLVVHESLSNLAIWVRSKRQPAANVLGYNMAFRKKEAEMVGGYKHDLNRAETRRAEDGWLTYEMIQATGKKVKRLTGKKVTIWTSDRRLMEKGNMTKAMINRIKAEIGYLNIFKKP